MKNTRTPNFHSAFLVCALAFATVVARAADPLPSWNDGATKKSIVDFVKRVTTPNSPEFVPESERIATFDNDGTLWAEQPVYVQVRFALDRVKALVPQHPEWRRKQPFKKLLNTPPDQNVAVSEAELMAMLVATHTGMTTAEFEQIVKDWIATARDPKTGRLYTEMVYQPMLELLAYLRTNGFKTFIVSGGGIEFMRPWTEHVYGVPPEQVIGSSVKTKYELRDGQPVLLRLPGIDFINDKDGKPIGIQSHIGRRPIAAFGNSDGDQQMLEWTQAGGGARFLLLVHHDDAVREFAYGPDSRIGTFSNALMAEAKARNWTVVSMKDDWATIFPPAKK
jgi:phosphoglycolate phosphatase-like HAD superfamily hydrolase